MIDLSPEEEAAAWRYHMVWSTNPLIRGSRAPPKPTRRLIPGYEKICIIGEQLDECKLLRVKTDAHIKQLEREMGILRDEQ